MRVLGIDYGDKHLGLAISDPLQLTAQTLGTYSLQTPEKDRLYFQDLIERFHISKIVIGLPLRMDGSTGTRVAKTRVFGDWLQKALEITIHYWDERLTTKQAMSILREDNIKMKKKKMLKDAISASLILSSFLEAHRKGPDDTEDS
jgi:putative Holliday junction resolvase